LTKLWYESYEPIQGAVEIINNLKEKGYDLFYLSDNVKERVEYLDSKYNFLSKFKDGVFSHEVGVRKPNPKIYKILLKKVPFNPSECVYIDDKSHLLEPAKELGLKVILFKNSKQLRNDLKKLGIEV
jgi:putative hydrolase of the HAD superfamily